MFAPEKFVLYKPGLPNPVEARVAPEKKAPPPDAKIVLYKPALATSGTVGRNLNVVG